MKKTFILFLLLTFSVFPGHIYALASDSMHAVPSISIFVSPSISPIPTPTPVDYQLPYPGLLPDNVLYKLKAFRDRVVAFFISDPLKKADFDILQADKRYNAGLFLYLQNSQKYDLIISTISKADNYMEEAIAQLQLAKKQGQDNRDLLNKMLLSNQKHLEVLNNIEKTTSDILRKKMMEEEGRIAHIKQVVNQELSKKQ